MPSGRSTSCGDKLSGPAQGSRVSPDAGDVQQAHGSVRGWGEGVAVSSDCREPVAIRRVRGTQRISENVAGGAERTLRGEASARRRSWET